MKIFDTFLFFNELDLLELRLHTLDPVVDIFVLSEATTTFSGKSKPLHFLENRARFTRFAHKIVHNVVDEAGTRGTDGEMPGTARLRTDPRRSYPHKHGGRPLAMLHPSCQREVHQRDAIADALQGVAGPGDMILSSDVDEIPRPESIREVARDLEGNTLYHFAQRWFVYFLNNVCPNEWFGTRACRMDFLMDRSIDLLRYPTEDRNGQMGQIIQNGGWHFSYLGGADAVRTKLEAVANQGLRATASQVLNRLMKSRLEQAIGENRDILFKGRTFSRVPIDESFPRYLRENPGRFGSYISGT